MPFFADNVLDEVRDAVNIVTLISEYVPLRKRGRNYVACCPFHHEKTPSFSVNEEGQFFHCFGCGLGGNVFKFIMQIENVSFPEAVQFLAARQGIALPAAADNAAPAPDQGNKKDLLNAMAETVAAYQQALLSSAEGQNALAYLRGRGITLSTIEKFRLGYAPAGGHFLVALLEKKGFPLAVLEGCGLCRRSEDGARSYDYFRGRVMFPITDAQGRVIAFGARAMDARPPKYLNSPETRLYNKSRNLFGLSYAREAIKQRGGALLVEGYMDCVVPFQYGVENVVASLGTSLTAEQVGLLGRYTHEVVVSYDPDSAGQSATQRSLELFLEADFRVRVLTLPDGLDPDEFVRQAGADEYRKREEEALPYLDFVLERAIQTQSGTDDPKKKVLALNTVLPFLARLQSPVERSEYVTRFARRLEIDNQQLLDELRKAAREKKERLTEGSPAVAVHMKPAEKRLLQLLLGHNELQEAIVPYCSPDDFSGLAAEKIFSIILAEFQLGRDCSFATLRRQSVYSADDRLQALLAQLEMEELPEDPTLATAESYLNALRQVSLSTRRERLKQEIASAAARGDDDSLGRLLEERVGLDRQLLELGEK